MNVRAPGRVAAALLLVLLPVICLGSPCASPDFYQDYTVYRGFQNNEAAWFICTSASNLAFADSTFFATMWNPWYPTKPDLAPCLVNALGTTPLVARPMYLVVNSGQGPVFDTRPGLDDYSGLWQVFLIRFKPGFVRPVTNTSISDPQGLPTLAEGQIIETDTVVDCPIVAVGQLAVIPSSVTPNQYRIPQAVYWTLDGILKTVMLPVYQVYSTDPLTGRPIVEGVIVTDAATQELADMFLANLAPRLGSFPDPAANNFWVMSKPRPPGQTPIVAETPTWGTRGYNPFYCPVMRYSELGRHIPAWTMISSRSTLLRLLDSGLLYEVAGGQKINGSLVKIN